MKRFSKQFSIKLSKNLYPVIVYENYLGYKFYGSKAVAKCALLFTEEEKAEIIGLIADNYKEPYRSSAISDIINATETIAEELVIATCRGDLNAAKRLAIYINLQLLSADLIKKQAEKINPETEEPYWMGFLDQRFDMGPMEPYRFNALSDALLGTEMETE